MSDCSAGRSKDCAPPNVIYASGTALPRAFARGVWSCHGQVHSHPVDDISIRLEAELERRDVQLQSQQQLSHCAAIPGGYG